MIMVPEIVAGDEPSGGEAMSALMMTVGVWARITGEHRLKQKRAKRKTVRHLNKQESFRSLLSSKSRSVGRVPDGGNDLFDDELV